MLYFVAIVVNQLNLGICFYLTRRILDLIRLHLFVPFSAREVSIKLFLRQPTRVRSKWHLASWKSLLSPHQYTVRDSHYWWACRDPSDKSRVPIHAGCNAPIYKGCRVQIHTGCRPPIHTGWRAPIHMSWFCLCWRCTRALMSSDPNVVLLHWAF